MRRAAAAGVVAALVVWLAVLGVAAQPAVHHAYDALAIRDGGTVWPSLSLRPKDEKYFLPVAILNHIEGPFQVLFLNAFYFVIGDALPLDPAVTQVPNTIFALASAGLAYLLVRRLVSARAAVCTALAFALMPWLGVTIRVPWVFNTASCLFQLLTLYLYAGFALEPERRLYRIGAPAALALYLTTGLDWPAFVLVLAAFLFLAGVLRPALRNRANVLPAAVMAAYLAWTVALFAYGRWGDPRRRELYRSTMLLYPFVKAGGAAPFPSLATVAAYARDTLGPALLAAVAGAGLAWKASSAVAAPRLTRAFYGAMVLWAVGTVIPLLRMSTSLTYGYVAAVPVAA
ncbi:MAG TPA: hypothetical protein VGT02_10845, partial [Methylomirabilota bacterium]|nr:hypothetical protein [Methylomirabilota bacterium]